MPARTNPFQELIWAIEKSVAGADCKVTESPGILEPITNKVREIDIIIEERRDGKIIKTAIECRDSNTPQDVTFIEELFGKYALLRREFVRVVAVSSSGFYSTALVKAQPLDIETRTLSEAINLEWKAVNVGMSKTASRAKSLFIFLENGECLNGDTVEMKTRAVVNSKGRVIGNFLNTIGTEFKEHLKVQKERITKELIKQRIFDKQLSVPVTLTCDVHGKHSLLDENGVLQKISKVQMDYYIDHFATESSANIYDYNEQSVTHGNIKLDSKQFELVMVENPKDSTIINSFVREVGNDKEMYVPKKKKSKKK